MLYRRLMVRIAERIARSEGAKALVTGDSLGQVASQTLANIACVDDAASMPVLRPLIGDDKQEIVTQAQRSGRTRRRSFPSKTVVRSSFRGHPQPVRRSVVPQGRS